MKKIKSIFVILTLLVLGTSCEKNLDLKPHQNLDESVALTSDANVKIVMVGAYSVLRSSEIYGGCILRNCEITGADGEIA